MKTDRKAVNNWVMGGTYVGTVECVLALSCMGWKNDEIAAAMPDILKAAGNEAIRAVGMNGGPAVPNLHDHMRAWGQRQAGMEVPA